LAALAASDAERFGTGSRTVPAFFGPTPTRSTDHPTCAGESLIADLSFALSKRSQAGFRLEHDSYTARNVMRRIDAEVDTVIQRLMTWMAVGTASP
jgi:hypothetical protein